MNKDLKNRTFNVPVNIIDMINQTISSLNGQHVYGIERAENIVKSGKVSYQQLKAIIHDIQNMDRVKESIKFKLMGGDLMDRWAKQFLDYQRLQIQNKKDITKQNSEIGGIDGVRKNSHNEKHRKKSNYKIPTNIVKSNSDKNSVSALTSSLKLFEEINKIKKLM